MTALEHIHLANIALLAADKAANKTEMSKQAMTALANRRGKVVALTTVQGVEGTPLLDEFNPLPVAKEADDKPAAKATSKKAAAKKPAAKKPVAKKASN